MKILTVQELMILIHQFAADKISREQVCEITGLDGVYIDQLKMAAIADMTPNNKGNTP